jgi:hypothetical protein
MQHGKAESRARRGNLFGQQRSQSWLMRDDLLSITAQGKAYEGLPAPRRR